MTVTHGIQLSGQFTGSPSSALNLATSTGPNALLQSGSYPLPSSSGHGPLTTVPLPGGFTYWRIDSGSSQFNLPSLWTSPTAAYVYNNTAANLGGIIPAGGLTIDGYFYPAGTYVFQFMDFTQGIIAGGTSNPASGYIYVTDGPSVLFRGCRFRGPTTDPGPISCEVSVYTGYLAVHYCDLGAMGPADSQQCNVALNHGINGGARYLRNYISYVWTGIHPNSVNAETIENFIEKITFFQGVGGGAHLNGISVNGGQANSLILRNHVATAATDDNGGTVNQTDCISLFQDFGTFPGTGTNSDGSKGYQIIGNYVAGTGYCFYIGQGGGTNPGTVANVNFRQNLISTSAYAAGGYSGPAAAIPPWGSYGNTEGVNFWADGPYANLSFLAPLQLVGSTYVNQNVSSPGPAISYTSQAGNTLVLCGFVGTGTTAAAGISSVSDSAGNTWHYSTSNSQNPPSQTGGTGSEHYVTFVAWTFQDKGTVTSVTAHDGTGNTDFWFLTLSEWSGLKAADGGAAGGGTASNPSSAALETTLAGDVIIAAVNSTATLTSPAALSNASLFQFSDGHVTRGAATAGATGPFPFQWSSSGSVDYAAAAMAFSTVTGPEMISYNTGHAQAQDFASNTYPLTIPAGVLTGDVMLLAVYGGYTAPLVTDLSVGSTGTAFTRIGAIQKYVGSYAFEAAVYYAVAGGGDPGATVTATFTNCNEWAMALTAYTGASNSAPIDVSGGTVANTTPSGICPSLTTVTDQDWAIQICAAARDNNSAVTEPSGTARLTGSDSSGAYIAFVDSNGGVSAGAGIGGGTFTQGSGNGSAYFNFTVALAPPAPAGSKKYLTGSAVAALMTAM